MKRLEQRNKRLNEEAGKFEVWHSVSYHNHFDGYAEYYEPGERRRKLRHIYIGEYYRQRLSLVQSCLLRILYICLFAGSIWACVSGACIPVASNCIWYVNIWQALTLPCAFYGLVSLVSYICMPEKIKRGQYRRAVCGLRKGTCCTGICCMLSAIATMLFMFVSGAGNYGEMLPCAARFLLAGMQLLLICLIEHKISYDTLENSAIPPEQSVIL